MEVHNAVTPTAEQIEGFLAPDAAGPIFMVNLLKFKERAEYEDGRETPLSGREAYALYAAEVAKVITQVGGKLILEIGFDQKFKTMKYLKKEGFYVNKVVKDYGNNDRCIISTKI